MIEKMVESCGYPTNLISAELDNIDQGEQAAETNAYRAKQPYSLTSEGLHSLSNTGMPEGLMHRSTCMESVQPL